MAKKQGLFNRNGTYYARVRVPKELVDQIGKVEIKVSLHTKDRAKAAVKLSEALEDIHRLFATASRASEAVVPEAVEVGRGELEQIVRAWFRPKLIETDESLWKPLPQGVLIDDVLDNIGAGFAALSSPGEEVYGAYMVKARELLSSTRYSNPTGSSIETLARYMIRGDLECLDISHRHYLKREFDHTPRDPLFRPVGGSSNDSGVASSVKLSNVVTVDQAVERFRSDPQRAKLGTKNIIGYNRGFKLLREIVGGDFPLRDVTRVHARKMQEVLTHLPSHAEKKFPRMTLLEAADYAKASGLPPIAAKTAEIILDNFSSFCRWAVREQIIDRTPADGLQATQKKLPKDEGRKPFSDADLLNLFSADLYRVPYPQVDSKQLHRYWIPLLALYSGARANELCQLDVADVCETDGIPFIRITPESEAGEEKKVKTRNAQRVVPVHPVLQQLGFLEYAESMRAAGHVRLFPGLTMSSSGYYSENFSKWFSRFLKLRGVTDSRVKFHSFRHGFNDATRVAGIPDAIVRELCGWATGDSMRDHYGSGHPLSQKAAELAKIAFPVVERLLADVIAERELNREASPVKIAG